MSGPRFCPVCGRRAAEIARDEPTDRDPFRQRVAYYRCAAGHRWTRTGVPDGSPDPVVPEGSPDPRRQELEGPRRSFGLGARRVERL